MKKNPIISVCIPVFDTELLLEACLESVIVQDFDSFEIVIVSDASLGRDSKGRSAKKIVHAMQKKCNSVRKAAGLSRVELRFIEHSENRGLIEVRRTLCCEAHGRYTTQLDSDDLMERGALSALYAATQNASIDIVHGTSVAGTFDDNGNFIQSNQNRYGKIFYGCIEGRDIFHRWLIDEDLTANTWGKLIKRELFIRAYENIPYTQCNMADDILLFFFLSQYAKSYIGIEAKVYKYRINTGMTSHRKIDTIHKWKMICSTASVFTIISEWIKENENALLPEEIEKVREMTRMYLANNLKQMREVVIPELQPAARELLCDYWGSDFVNTIEQVNSK